MLVYTLVWQKIGTNWVSHSRIKTPRTFDCASILCNYHVHHIQNVEEFSFVLLFVRLVSRMPHEFVVAGEVKRSAGGSTT